MQWLRAYCVFWTDAVTDVACSSGKRRVAKIVRKMPDYYDLARIEVRILEKLKDLDPDGKQLVWCWHVVSAVVHKLMMRSTVVHDLKRELIYSVVTVAGICNSVGGGVFLDIPPRWRCRWQWRISVCFKARVVNWKQLKQVDVAASRSRSPLLRSHAIKWRDQMTWYLNDSRCCFAGVMGSFDFFEDTAPRKTAENTAKHRYGCVGASQPPRWRWNFGGRNNTANLVAIRLSWL